MLTLLLALPAVAGPGPLPARAPVHYKIVSKQIMDIDLSAMGQPAMNVVMTATAFVSATTSDTAGGTLVHVVVDSSTFDGGMVSAQLPAEYTASPKGAVYHVYVVNGKPNAPIIPAPTTIQGGQLGAGVELIIAGLRNTTSGTSWVDSTVTDATAPSGASIRVTNWTAKAAAGGQTQIDGTWTGTNSVGQGMMKMDLKMTGATHITAPAGGLSETATSTGSGQANMNMGGQSIPMKVTMDISASTIP